MKILADTNLFVFFCERLPIPAAVEKALSNPATERFISPISVMEIFRLWKKGVIRKNPDRWLPTALPSWTVLPVTVEIARQAVLFDWDHRDPGDRLLAATAKLERVELWHTDTVLKTLKGFPGKYFKAPSR